MKATLEIPEALFRAIKVRAAQQGQKLKDVVTDLLAKGLEVANIESTLHKAEIVLSEESGLPTVKCRNQADRADALSPSDTSALLLQQEVDRHDEAHR